VFEVAANYDRFMGRYSEPLAGELVAAAELTAGARCLDVGCGPGALIAELVGRVGAAGVVGVDPSEPFVAAARDRFPDVDVRVAPAEDLPFEDGSFDAAFASLVVHFMADPVAGLREMGRVVRPGGLVAATVWDFAGERGPLSLFWRAVLELDPGAQTEAQLAGARQGHLVELAGEAGLENPVEKLLTVSSAYRDFEEWWEPYTLGVGPAGAYVSGLEEEARTRLREHCRRQLPDGPFEVPASAWAVLAQSAFS
jgi:SAM-dependent methyltransferase